MIIIIYFKIYYYNMIISIGVLYCIVKENLIILCYKMEGLPCLNVLLFLLLDRRRVV